MYTLASDVAVRLKSFRLDNFGVLETEDIERFIEEIEGEVNGILRALAYPQVPAVDDGDIALLRRYVADKVACMTYSFLVVGQDLPEGVRNWCSDYKDFLNRLRKQEQMLPSQEPVEDDPVGMVGSTYNRDYYFPDLVPPPTDREPYA